MNGDLIKVGKLEIRYLLDGSQNGGLGVFKMTTAPKSIWLVSVQRLIRR